MDAPFNTLERTALLGNNIGTLILIPVSDVI